MKVQFGNRQYEMWRASNVVLDGMALELYNVTDGNLIPVLEAFWSDADGSFTFSAYRENLPFELVEMFVQQAREGLPPIKQDD